MAGDVVVAIVVAAAIVALAVVVIVVVVVAPVFNSVPQALIAMLKVIVFGPTPV